MIGPTLPCCNVEAHAAQYSHVMLLLFKPWQRVADLKSAEESWEFAFENFLALPECDLDIHEIMNNMQLLHECKDSRDSHMKNRNRQPTGFVTSEMINASQTAQEDDLNESLHENALHNLLVTVADKNSEKISRSSEDISSVLTHFENSGLCQMPLTSREFPADGVIELIDGSDTGYENLWKNAYDARKLSWKERQINLGLNSAGTSGSRLDDVGALIQTKKSTSYPNTGCKSQYLC